MAQEREPKERKTIGEMLTEADQTVDYTPLMDLLLEMQYGENLVIPSDPSQYFDYGPSLPQEPPSRHST